MAEGTILIIIIEGCSIPIYLFGFIFTVSWNQLSSSLPQKRIYIGPTDF